MQQAKIVGPEGTQTLADSQWTDRNKATYLSFTTDEAGFPTGKEHGHSHFGEGHQYDKSKRMTDAQGMVESDADSLEYESS
jgi:hypothetical protein